MYEYHKNNFGKWYHEVTMEDDNPSPPPLPPKYHVPLEIEIPADDLATLERLSSNDSLTVVDVTLTPSMKPSPAPRKSLQCPKKDLAEKPVPMPRNLFHSQPVVENPVYYMVSIANDNGLKIINDESDCEEQYGESESQSEVVEASELVDEFDPFAPGRSSLEPEQLSLHLTGSMFALDRINASEDICKREKKKPSFDPDTSPSTQISSIEKLAQSPRPVSPNIYASYADANHYSVDGDNETSVQKTNSTVITEELDTLIKDLEDKTQSHAPAVDFDPPSFPPPPLPDGFSGSTLSLLEAPAFLESLEMFSDESKPVPPPRDASSSLVPTSPKPPLPPKTHSRSQTPELGKSRSASPSISSLLSFKKNSSAASSTESSPDLRRHPYTISVIGDKVPPPPSSTGNVKPPRPAMYPPQTCPNASSNSETSPPPPLPPKSNKGHSRTRSWNFITSESICSLFRSSSSKAGNSANPPQTNNQSLTRPALLNKILQQGFPHSGMLYKTGSNRKDFRQRWCVLEHCQLKYFTDEKAEIPQNSIHERDMLSVGKVRDVKNNAYDLSCFEINTLKDKGRSYLFGAPIPSDREGWLEHILLTIAPQQCKNDNRDFTKAGYVFTRFGMTGTWVKSWILHRDRMLTVTCLNNEHYELLDLRKAMNISMHPADKVQSCPEVVEEGASFHLDFPGKSFYVQAHLRKETDGWYSLLRNAMYNNGDKIETYQLTINDVPVIVEKCISFVSVHGCTVEGIYRVDGTKSVVSKLLAALKQDAWGFTIKPGEYNANEVASALKRFLRTLPDPLLKGTLHDEWLRASVMEKEREKLPVYERLLQSLPKVNYSTLRCLIGHLRGINENSNHNLMTTNNLASIFGPTLLTTQVDNYVPNLLNANLEMDVIADLVNNYPMLFKVSIDELKKDLMLQQAVLDIKEAKKCRKPAGDILTGVYIHSKEYGKCLNVRVSPSMTTLDLCHYALQNVRIKEKLEHLTVFEVVNNGEMERPLHFSEIVLSVTLQWARWADSEAKDNYLVIKRNDLYLQVLPLARQPLSMFSELRFADRKSKHFKKFLLEFKNARLSFYKDAKITQPEGTWNIEDIIWYIGYEQKRPCPTKWAFTFIDKRDGVRRTKDASYFGWTVCCNSEEVFHKWIAAMLIGEYPNGLVPKREPIDLLT